MKRFTLLLLILFTLVMSLQAQPEKLMQQLSKACTINNADYFYDLGVDFYAAGEAGYANWCWLQALNLNSAHSQARANLELSQRLSPDASLYPPRPFLVRVIHQFLNFFSVNRLAVLSLILLLGSGISLAWLLNYNPQKERALPILVLSLMIILCVSAFTALGIKTYQQRNNNQAVVISPKATLYDDGGKTAVLEIHAGLVLEILEKKEDYWRVRLPNGQTGRVIPSQVKALIP